MDPHPFKLGHLVKDMMIKALERIFSSFCPLRSLRLFLGTSLRNKVLQMKFMLVQKHTVLDSRPGLSHLLLLGTTIVMLLWG